MWRGQRRPATVRLVAPCLVTGATSKSGPRRYWSSTPTHAGSSGNSNHSGRIVGAPKALTLAASSRKYGRSSSARTRTYLPPGGHDEEEHELDDEPAHPMVPAIYLEFEDRFQKDRFDVDPKDRWATEGEEGHGLLDMGKMMEGHRPVRRSQRVAQV